MVEKVARARARQAKTAKVQARANKAPKEDATPAGALTTTTSVQTREKDQSEGKRSRSVLSSRWSLNQGNLGRRATR